MHSSTNNRRLAPHDDHAGNPSAHRQHGSIGSPSPVWTWGVVLVSTLLLASPVLSSSALSAALLAEAYASAAASSVAASCQNRVGVAAPRRLDEEEEAALRAAAQSGKAILVRLDGSEGDVRQNEGESPLYALFVLQCASPPSRAAKRISFADPLSCVEIARPNPEAVSSALRAWSARARAPRAPPLSFV